MQSGAGTHRRSRPVLAAVVGAAVVAVGLVVAALAADPSAAQRPEATNCPTMTDSITRLYRAFFNRTPGEPEFQAVTARYRSGQANLEVLASEFAQSDEFQTRYGELDDERYVELVYRNVLRRDPEPNDRDFWITNLGSGYDRGSMMIAFSESEEFIQRTDTATPLAGFLRWYPEGTHWYCGVGPQTNLPIRPLEEPTLYADFMFHNIGQAQSTIGIQTALNGAPHLTISEGSLPPGFSDYKWGGLFDGDGDYGTALNINAGRNTSWVVVFYPNSIGEQRLGWQVVS